jgi:transposase
MGKHKKIKLTESSKGDLASRLKHSRESLKIAVILMLDAGMDQLLIAKTFDLHPDTVARIKLAYEEQNKDWTDDNHKGGTSKLNPDQKEKVATYLDQNNINDASLIQKYILEQFQINYSLSGIYGLLEKEGFIYDYPKPILKGDIPDQKLWLKKFEKLVQKLPRDQVILFSDAVHPTHNSQFTKMWMRKDKPKTLSTNSGRQRINIQGSYDVTNQDGIFTQHDTINTQSIIEHYQKILEKYPTKSTIHIVEDNARYYFGEAKRWIQTHNRKHHSTKLRIHKIPPYSPNLNKIEKLWLFLKKTLIHNKHYEKFKDFKKAINNFLDNIGNYQEQLKTFITLKFHIEEALLC